jgi:hypothetical protein
MHEHQTVTADLSGASVHRDKPAATDSPFSCTPRLLNDAGARQLVPGSVSAVSVENAPVADSSEAKSKTKSKLRGGFWLLPKPRWLARFEMNAEKRSG